MRTTGGFVAAVLDDLASRARVGVNLLDLEYRARDLLAERGVVSCYWDYAPSFGHIDGWVADSARSLIVGTPDAEDHRLIEATEQALSAGIAAAHSGNRLGDISAAIGAVATKYDYPVNTEFGGHGLGRTMHEDPHVSNQGKAGRGLRLRPGLTLALEPWFARDTDKIVYDSDGWTIRSADGSRTAHSEHTIAVTDDEPLILTTP